MANGMGGGFDPRIGFNPMIAAEQRAMKQVRKRYTRTQWTLKIHGHGKGRKNAARRKALELPSFK